MNTQKLNHAILALALFSGCMASRDGELVQPQPGPAHGELGPGEDATDKGPGQWNEPGVEGSSVQLELDKEAFATYAIDTNALFYTLDFQDESGRSLTKVDRTRLDFDAASGKATVKVKVPNGAVGYVYLKIEDNIPENDKFEGRSDKVTVTGPTRIAMTLQKIGDANVTVSVTFDEDVDGTTDQDSSDDDQDQGSSGPDVSGISDPELRELALRLGDPKTMQAPTLAQIQPIARAFCYDCHKPGGMARGDATTESFYREKPITGHMNSKTMPSPATSYSEKMDSLAAAGFDYRAVFSRYAKSLGNDR